MTVRDIVTALPVKVAVAPCGLDVRVSGGYVSDILSSVIGSAAAGDVWITARAHPNIIAVAVLAELAAVIVAGGFEPERETVRKAGEKGVILLLSDLSSFELAGRLYQFGVR